MQNNERHTTATNTSDSTMLLFLRRQFSNAVMYCTFGRIRKPMTADRRHRKKPIGLQAAGTRTRALLFSHKRELAKQLLLLPIRNFRNAILLCQF